MNHCIANEQWFSWDEVEFVVVESLHLNEIANECCVTAVVENSIVEEGVITCRSDCLK